ncbi:hypothetical protein, partial [Burkholderia cenocepacia]|uniref:hypothetical protein n=1 Tax=Burkholderia cenocepacia TaxID=95486 RepID=UPI00195590B4
NVPSSATATKPKFIQSRETHEALAESACRNNLGPKIDCASPLSISADAPPRLLGRLRWRVPISGMRTT